MPRIYVGHGDSPKRGPLSEDEGRQWVKSKKAKDRHPTIRIQGRGWTGEWQTSPGSPQKEPVLLTPRNGTSSPGDSALVVF